MTTREGEESDQLPEEQPSGAVPDDTGTGDDARKDAKDSPGAADNDDESKKSSGKPKATGQAD